jgi:hypothetical protein
MPDGMISPREPAPIRLNRGSGVDPRGLHHCDDQCICPIHKLQLFYSRQFRKHACQDPSCVHAHGMRNPDEYGFESVRIMRLQPDDVIVVEVGYPVSAHDIDQFKARLEHTFPGHRAIVLDNGARLRVARPDADLGSVKPNPETTVDGDTICDGPEECGHPAHNAPDWNLG